MKVLLTGATGFIGSQFLKSAHAKGYEVIAISRKPPKTTKNFQLASRWMTWHELETEGLPQCDAVVHLAGARLQLRPWTSSYKKKLEKSRIETTECLTQLTLKTSNPPEVFIQASAVGYYANKGGPYDENSAPGDHFLGQLCKKWESASKPLEKTQVRQVQLRLGTVLGQGGGLWPHLSLSTALGVIPKFLDGTQPFSWIHIDDLLTIIFSAIESSSFQGPLNVVASASTNHNELNQTLLDLVNQRAFVIKINERFLQIILGEGSSLLLTSSLIENTKLKSLGHTFQYPTINQALKQIESLYPSSSYSFSMSTVISKSVSYGIKFFCTLSSFFGYQKEDWLKNICQRLRKPFIQAHCNCQFGNELFIRGELKGLSWHKGVKMVNIGADHWIWIGSKSSSAPFKVLINDQQFETGPNHHLNECFSSITPHFNLNE
jgi:uncharacterized protein (TIGR01777 family)